jgi:flavin-dependent dehydrogenase
LNAVRIVGSGPAGAAAAISCAHEGASVFLSEKSTLPKHKVCGEFYTPEIVPLLERLGVWQEWLALKPARIRRMVLHFGNREKRCTLPETAYGCSRFAFDQMLAGCAAAAGAVPVREAPHEPTPPVVIASGRAAGAPRGRRLFGFKAHFDGPVDDAVHLFFFGRCYAGVSRVEGGRTNVCGLAPEDVLGRVAFHPEALLEQSPALRERLVPLARRTDWLITGPLVFQNGFHRPPKEAVYPAGDALSFVDPFTGSGIAAAVLTGRMAGVAAARGTPVANYLRECRSALGGPFEVAVLFRKVVASGWAHSLAPFVPGKWLFQWTRPAA